MVRGILGLESPEVAILLQICMDFYGWSSSGCPCYCKIMLGFMAGEARMAISLQDYMGLYGWSSVVGPFYCKSAWDCMAGVTWSHRKPAQ